MLSCWRLSLVSWTDLVVLSGINFDQPHCINKSRGKVGSLFVGAMVPVAVHLQLAELAELGKKQMHHFVSPDLFSSKTHYNLETSRDVSESEALLYSKHPLWCPSWHCQVWDPRLQQERSFTRNRGCGGGGQVLVVC